jgi:hypothetical protein
MKSKQQKEPPAFDAMMRKVALLKPSKPKKNAKRKKP